METEELKKQHETMKTLFWLPMLSYPVIVAISYLKGYNEIAPVRDYDTFTYIAESISILVSLVFFWLALRMLSHRAMLTWFVRNGSSYVSLVLLRQALLHSIIILGLLTHFLMGCPTTHWLSVLGVIGLLFILPTKRRIMEESRLIDEIRQNKD